jgi:NADH pyrophosphatase NudC (nudix superfamily)
MSPNESKFCARCGSDLAPHLEEGRTRLRCGACGLVVYGNPTPVVAAIVEHRRDAADADPPHVLLARGAGWPEKMFGLITGFLEAGESPEAGILREVKEELGLDGEVVSLVGAYAFEQRNELIVAYHVRATGEITLSPELEATKRIAVDKLRPWPFGTGHAVRDWLARSG